MDIKDNESLLKELWDTINKDNINQKTYEDVLTTWKEYRTSIENNTLSLDDYTNLITDDTPEYLTNFLERTSKIFGTSKGGFATQYMLKRNAQDQETYYLKTKDKKEEKSVSRTEAEKHFTAYILPLLQKVISSNDENELSKLETNRYDGFAAVQILRKMIILNDLVDHEKNGDFQYIQIFQDDTIDNLYVDLGLNENDAENNSENENTTKTTGNEKEAVKNLDFYTKNREITEKIKKIIKPNNEKADIPYMIKLSRLLWKFENMAFANFPDEKTPNVIFYGAPGTGKTHAVKEFLKYKKIDNDHYVWAQFHPSFNYEDFIDGIKPTGIEGNQIKLELCNGMFKDLCIKAKKALEDEKRKDEEFYFIADEINRANLSSVFGETLSLLEADYRDNPTEDTNRKLIQLQNSKIAEHIGYKNSYEIDHRFGIPKNVYFIGMMNDVDKSIDSFDLALRRRFKWIRMDCDYEVIEREISKEGIDDYIDNCKALNAYISGIDEENKPVTESLGLGKSYEFGHSFFLKMKDFKIRKITDDSKKKLFEGYLRPTLKEYLRSSVSELEIEKKLKEAQNIFCKNN